jgi:hypothetical protein
MKLVVSQVGTPKFGVKIIQFQRENSGLGGMNSFQSIYGKAAESHTIAVGEVVEFSDEKFHVIPSKGKNKQGKEVTYLHLQEK